MSYREASFHLVEQKEQNIRVGETKEKEAQKEIEKVKRKREKTNVRANIHECVRE